MTTWPDGSDRPGLVRGSVHSWDLSVGVDGPGTRFVMFTAGCPLRCLYCENPDTWLHRNGETMTVADVMERVEHYRPALQASGGGVTVSGGEPLAQASFTSAFLHLCKRSGLHTALDTSGFLGAVASDEMLQDVDLTLLDVKSYDPDTYRRVTGRELGPTLVFARRLAELQRPVWIRFVLVPGLTDARENVAGLAGFVGGLPNVERVDVVAYHRLGAPKYERLGITYPLAGTPSPSDEQLEDARTIFREEGLTVT